jgi:hypothetical protein
VNEGNLREMLKMRVRCGDIVLEDHLKSAGRNALYTSPEVQNDIIDCYGKEIQKEIVKRAKPSQMVCYHFR